MASALIAGATGYSILEVSPFLVWFKSQYPDHKITATSRSTENTKLLLNFGGVDVVEITDLSEFQSAASKADLVVNFTGAANLPLIRAIISGLKERFERTKTRPIFIHAGGATSILDPTPFTQSQVFSDTDNKRLRAIPGTNRNHGIDLVIQAADTAGYLWGYILSLPLVYGQSQIAFGRSVSAGWHSFLLPSIFLRREVAYVRDGSYTWDSVHIDDLIELLALVTAYALSGKAESPDPWDRFFFAGNDKPTSLKAILDRIAPVLHAEHLVDTPYAVGRLPEEVAWFLSGNMRGSADRGKALGWNPSRPSILEGLEDEIRNAVEIV